MMWATRLASPSMIRPATESDVPAMVEMGRRFAESYRLPATMEHAADVLRRMIHSPTSLVLVAQSDGLLVGLLVAAITGPWFDPTARVATELAWWVNEDVRNQAHGVRMVLELERWAQDQGATHVCLSDLAADETFPYGKLFDRLGYQLIERSHVKEIV